MLFPPLDERNTRDKAEGLRTSSERSVGELGVRCLSRINSGRTLGSSLRRADARRSLEGSEGLTSTFCTFV